MVNVDLRNKIKEEQVHCSFTLDKSLKLKYESVAEDLNVSLATLLRIVLEANQYHIEGTVEYRYSDDYSIEEYESIMDKYQCFDFE